MLFQIGLVIFIFGISYSSYYVDKNKLAGNMI